MLCSRLPEPWSDGERIVEAHQIIHQTPHKHLHRNWYGKNPSQVGINKLKFEKMQGKMAGHCECLLVKIQLSSICLLTQNCASAHICWCKLDCRPLLALSVCVLVKIELLSVCLPKGKMYKTNLALKKLIFTWLK